MACSLPSGGGTSPFTIAGTVFLESVEILVILIISQVIKPGTPVIASPIPFMLDMATGNALQSSVEAMLAASLSTEFIKNAFHLPTATSVFESDAYICNEQAVLESMP
jgi:trimethylamine:corrinoid methyltransferase-like protein